MYGVNYIIFESNVDQLIKSYSINDEEEQFLLSNDSPFISKDNSRKDIEEILEKNTHVSIFNLIFSAWIHISYGIKYRY